MIETLAPSPTPPSSALTKVLVVDDDKYSLVALSSLLEGPDRQVIAVSSGEEALKYLLEGDCGVVLLDIKMSGMDGLETARLIRGRAKTKDIPIIFLTGYRKEEADILQGYSHGAVDYIMKPIVPEILQSKVNVLVGLARKATDIRRKHGQIDSEGAVMLTKAAHAIVRQIPDPVFISDLQGVVVQANDAAIKLFRLRGEEFGDAMLAQSFRPDEIAALKAAFQDAIRSGAKHHVKLHPRLAEGTSALMVLNVAALQDEGGEVRGAIGVLRDISAYDQALLKECEQYRQAASDYGLKVASLEREVVELKAKMPAGISDAQ